MGFSALVPLPESHGFRRRGPKFRRREPMSWSREVAYAVGLVATDGCMSPPRYVSFGSTDRELVETFLRCVGRPIRYSTRSALAIARSRPLIVPTRDFHIAMFSDAALYRFLMSVGIGPRKSHAIGRLQVPPMHLPDVIRGLLDGDGSVMSLMSAPWGKSHQYRRLRLRIEFCSGSREHLEWLRHELAWLSIRSSLREDRRFVPGVFHLLLTDRQGDALLSVLYQDPKAPRLHRKWQIWNTYRETLGLPERYAFL